MRRLTVSALIPLRVPRDATVPRVGAVMPVTVNRQSALELALMNFVCRHGARLRRLHDLTIDTPRHKNTPRLLPVGG